MIDQIEGEASVYFDVKNDKVSYASIAFPHFRGMESILEGKHAMDALVITPRVCGICGHAHLMACVRAIESAYENAGKPVVLSQKAKDIRELTLVLEMIQNHFKWLYLVIIPAINKLSKSDNENYPLKGIFASSLAAKALAVFAGQWPHSSYMLPGGVTCDPTHLERIKSEGYIDELIEFFEKEVVGIELERFLSFNHCKDFNRIKSDIGNLEKNLIKIRMNKKGFAHDKFIVLGKHSFTKTAKLKQTRLFQVNSKYISLEEAYSPDEKSYAKNATYRNEFYEGGPIARAISFNNPLIKNMHRRFKDSAYTRVMARVFEIATLLKQSKNLLSKMSLSGDSYTTPMKIEGLTSEGTGIVEAPRGPLVHTIKIENGIIKKYEIITPTQWNLGSSVKNKLSPSQRAMRGSSVEEALFIFRTFDVCSVCTTH